MLMFAGITRVWRRDCCQVAAATRAPRTTRQGVDICSVYDVTPSSVTSSSTQSTRRVKPWTWAYSWRRYATSIRPTTGRTWQHIEELFRCLASRLW